MNFSGILIFTAPDQTLHCRELICTISGIDVFQYDEATGRIIAVMEADTIEEEIQMLKHVKAVPNVVAAELVYHHFEEDGKQYDKIPPELDELQGLSEHLVPSTLND